MDSCSNKGEAASNEDATYLNPWGDDDLLAKSLKEFEERKAQLQAKQDDTAIAPHRKDTSHAQKKETKDAAKKQKEHPDKQPVSYRKNRTNRDRSLSPSPSRRRDSTYSRSDRHRYSDKHHRHRTDHYESKHRSRRRDRSRKNYRRRSRSRSRSRSRNRSQSTSSNRSSGESRSRSQSPVHKHSRKYSHRNTDLDRRKKKDDDVAKSHNENKSGSEDKDQLFNFTAPLVVDRFLEIWSNNNKASSRVKELIDIFDVEDFEVVGLIRREILMKGEDLEESIKMTRPWKSEPSKRLFVESNRPGDPTYALDMYKKGLGPCFTHIGYSTHPPTTSAVLLYRIYAAEDTEGLVIEDDVSEDDIMMSNIGKQAFDVMIRPGGLGGTDITRVFHNYENIQVIG
eukprot:gene9195-1481_t